MLDLADIPLQALVLVVGPEGASAHALLVGRGQRSVLVGRGARAGRSAVTGDPAALPVRARAFDAAIAAGALHAASDPEAVLAELVRALRAGGLLVIRERLEGGLTAAALCAHFAGERLAVEGHRVHAATDEAAGTDRPALVATWILRAGGGEPAPGGDR